MPESPTRQIVIVDDDPALATLVHRWLHLEGYAVRVFETGEDAIDGLANLMPDCLLLDLNLPGIDGIQVLDFLKARWPLLPVVMMTADSDVDSVVEAMRLGAYDYVTKPLDRVGFMKSVRNATERLEMAIRLKHLEREQVQEGYGRLVGRADSMKSLFKQMDRVAVSDVTVLIRGESGTGKELVAQAIHEASGRAEGPFEAVNCAAIPPTLQESELFGHEKGAFTGATSRRIGRFETANNGTLFLDELGDLASEAQAKLLRVVQERRFNRVGGTEEVRSDFRLVAATHRDLEEMVREGTFREDLFFRVAVFELTLPSLRERREDIPILVEHLLARGARGRRTPSVAPEAMAVLLAWDWPGNVRELSNALERALVTCDDEITVDDLPPRVAKGAAGLPVTAASTSYDSSAGAGEVLVPDELDLRVIEKRTIERALLITDGNLSEAAQRLGIGRTTLYRKLERYGIANP